MYGNSAMGVVSGHYIPPTAEGVESNPNVTPATNSMTYSTSRASSVAGPLSPEPTNINLVPPIAHTNVRPIHRNQAQMRQFLQGPAWGPTQMQAQAMGASAQDVPMLDIDWTEWDKLFPLEMNNGELDTPGHN